MELDLVTKINSPKGNIIFKKNEGLKGRKMLAKFEAMRTPLELDGGICTVKI